MKKSRIRSGRNAKTSGNARKTISLNSYPRLQMSVDRGPKTLGTIAKWLKNTKLGRATGWAINAGIITTMLLGCNPSTDKAKTTANASVYSKEAGGEILTLGEMYKYYKGDEKTTLEYKLGNVAILNDVQPGYWAETAIRKAINNNIALNYNCWEGLYYPEGTTTREVFAAMLVNAVNSRIEIVQNPFNDVDSRFMGHVRYAAKLGLVNGIGNGQFGPTLDVTRQDAAVMLAGALDKFYPYPIVMTERSFTDQDQIAPYAQAAVQKVVSAGLMSGYPDGSFNPTGGIRNDETAVIMVNLAEKILGQPLPLPQPTAPGEVVQYSEWEYAQYYVPVVSDTITRDVIMAGLGGCMMPDGQFCEVQTFEYYERHALGQNYEYPQMGNIITNTGEVNNQNNSVTDGNSLVLGK